MTQVIFECSANCGLNVEADNAKVDPSMIAEVVITTFANHEHGQKVVFHNGDKTNVSMLLKATADQSGLIEDLVTPEQR